MKPKCSCKDCDKRVLGCHSTCADYISYKKELEDERKKYSEWYRNKHWKVEHINPPRNHGVFKSKKRRNDGFGYGYE